MPIANYPTIRARSFAAAYEDLPAFHAAYFMLTLIFAGLCDIGFFAVLIVIHVVLDLWKYKVVQELTLTETLHATFRENLTDSSLFLLALTALLYLNPIVPSIAILTGPFALTATIARGLAILLPKLTILHHSLRILFNMHDHLHGPSTRSPDQWSVVEFLSLAVMLVSICLLVATPLLVHVPQADLRAIVLGQMVPWRF